MRLAGLAGRRLDESQPWVDGLLPRGVRLHAVLPPLAFRAFGPEDVLAAHAYYTTYDGCVRGLAGALRRLRGLTDLGLRG